MTQTLLQQWAQCQTILADNLTSSAYQTWFAPIVPLSYSEGVLVLQVKSQFVAEYIEENYIPLLSAAIIRVFGQGTRLEYRVLIDSASGAATMLPSTGAPERGNWQITNTQKPVTNEDLPKLNELYTFDSFIQPGYTAFNPLFIYGGSGVGKTHLACAIGHQAQALNPHARVLYVSANTFKLQFQDARKENRIPDFLNFYQSVDVLIVDDIQYFAGLKGTQDTFFHIFNYLQQSRKQLILTCDKPPVQLKDIEDRLLTRFKWGLAQGYDYIFEMDADFSHAPSDLPRLYSACADEGYDLAIGSRYVSGVNVVNWPMGRVLMSYFASKYVRFITGFQVHDTTAGFKCYKRRVLETIDLDAIRFKGYAFQIEMKFTTYKCGFKIKEVPVIFVNRVEGVSKMNSGIFGEAFFGVMRLRWDGWFRKYPKPIDKQMKQN